MKDKKVPRKIKCDFCGIQEAKFLAKTIYGKWSYMCEVCFARNGIGLGPGKGKTLIDKEENRGFNE